jgi:flagellar protein FliS
MLLFDGALAAARLGLGHLQAGRIADKAAAVSKVTRIIDEGLKLSLDRTAGGELSTRLADLYDYMIMRLLQANLRNDGSALAEVIKLLDDLRSAWAAIKGSVSSAAAGAAAASTSRVAPESAPSLPQTPAPEQSSAMSRRYASSVSSGRLAATA